MFGATGFSLYFEAGQGPKILRVAGREGSVSPGWRVATSEHERDCNDDQNAGGQH